MRVVSQDRKLSFDFDRCEIWVQDKCIFRRIDGDSHVIGKYESDERAAEVFEDIHKYCTGDIYMFKNVEFKEDFKDTLERMKRNAMYSRYDSYGPEIKRLINGVFYMPEEQL